MGLYEGQRGSISEIISCLLNPYLAITSVSDRVKVSVEFFDEASSSPSYLGGEYRQGSGIQSELIECATK